MEAASHSVLVPAPLPSFLIKSAMNLSHLCCHLVNAAAFSVSFNALYLSEFLASFLSVRRSLLPDAIPKNAI